MTRGALFDAVDGLRKVRVKGNDTSFGGFEKLFGHSQQYLSFVRCSNYF